MSGFRWVVSGRADCGFDVEVEFAYGAVVAWVGGVAPFVGEVYVSAAYDDVGEGGAADVLAVRAGFVGGDFVVGGAVVAEAGVVVYFLVFCVVVGPVDGWELFVGVHDGFVARPVESAGHSVFVGVADEFFDGAVEAGAIWFAEDAGLYVDAGDVSRRVGSCFDVAGVFGEGGVFE